VLTLSSLLTIFVTCELFMSDGPHRSLPMRRWWRRLAERADNCAFAVDEVADSLVPALESECFNELPSTFLQHLRGLAAAPSLFGPAESPQIHGLSAETQSGFARRVLDHIAVLSPAEAAATDFPQRALENAIHGEAPRYFRQIEEHYQRSASFSRAQGERARLDEALRRADVGAVARKLLETAGSRPVSLVPLKTGLNEGVTLL